MTLKSTIGAVRKGLANACQTGQRREAVRGVALAQQRVAKDTTSLMRTIHTEDRDALTVLLVAGDPSATRPNDGQPVNYAGYLEYGTSKMAAQPFMGPTARELRPAVEIATELQSLYRRNGV